MPVTGELAQQNIKDRYYGVNDPVAMKLLNKAGEMPSLEPPEDESIRTLYVGGIDERVTEQDLRDNFYAHGEIESVRMVLQRACAFVTYTTREGAEKAAEELSNKLVIKGLRLKLMWGRPQAPKQDSEGTDEARQQAVAHSGLLPRAVISQQQNQIQDPSAPVQHYYNMPPPSSSHERTFYPSMDSQRMGAVVRSQDGAPSGPTGENKSGSERQHYAFQTMAPPHGHYHQQQFYPPPYAGYMPPPPPAYQQQYRPQYHAAVPPQQSLPMNPQYQQQSAAPTASSSGPSESTPSESGSTPTASSQQ